MHSFEEFGRLAKRHRQEATKWYARVGPKAGDWETVTVGTASGWLGVGPDDYFELNDALGGPHAQVNGHRGRASIQALEAFVERLAPHLTGKYGGEEIPKIIDMQKAGKLDTGGSARGSATQAGMAREPVRSPSPAPAANPPSAKKDASQPNVVVQTQAPASEEGQPATALFRQWNRDLLRLPCGRRARGCQRRTGDRVGGRADRGQALR